MSTEHSISDAALAEFVAATGVDIAQAKCCLRDYSCDVIGALKAFEQKAYHQTMVNVNHNAHNGTQPEASGLKPSQHHNQNGATNGSTNGLPPDSDTLPNILINGDDAKHTLTSPSTSQQSMQNGGSSSNGGRKAADDDDEATTAATGTCHIETPSYTFTLPDLSTLTPEFRKFLERDLIETGAQRLLEASGYLNWWLGAPGVVKLWPLATSGDGNCLLHAASLGMWGFHDRLLILRNALHTLLTKGARRHALWRRWRWHQTRINQQSGLIYSEAEWRTEWANLVQLSSAEPRSKVLMRKKPEEKPSDAKCDTTTEDTKSPVEPEFEPCTSATYESLEDLHVFALAHVLKRPIIVIADTVLRDAEGQPMAPIPFRGIYLPLECHPDESHRAPLVLCYDTAHFSALVAMQSANLSGNARVPITCRQRRLLPVHFANDPGADFTWWADERDERIAEATRMSERDKLRLVDTLELPLPRSTSCHRTSCTLPNSASAPLNSAWVTSNVHTVKSGSYGTVNHVGVAGRTGTRETRERQIVLACKQAKDRCKEAWKKVKSSSTRSRNGSGSAFPSVPQHNMTDFNSAELKNELEVATHDGQLLPLAELHSQQRLVCARLLPDTHHQYMKEMVDNYLLSARKRFENLYVSTADATAASSSGLLPTSQSTAAKSVSVSPDGASSQTSTRSSRRRERGISRSLSTTSMVVECMNGNCTQLASTSTNYLCQGCFATQKEVMASFTRGHRRTESAATTAACMALVNPRMRVEPKRSSVNKSTTLPHTMIETSFNGEEAATLLTLRDGNLTTHRYVKGGATSCTTGSSHCYHQTTGETSMCRSALCANYSNGCETLCAQCAARNSAAQQHHQQHNKVV